MSSKTLTPEQEHALRLQAEELLHYKKTKMGKDIQDRADKRINDLAAAQLAALGVAININNDKASAQVNAPAVKQNTRVPPPVPPPVQTNNSPRKNISSKRPVDGITWGQLEALGLPGLELPSKTPQHEPAPPRKRSSPEETGTHAPEVPWAIPTGPIIPKSVELLWQRLTALDPFPNTPKCCCDTCPFTTGALMLRRYNIMLAMMNLEDHLYYTGVMMP